MNYLKLMKLLYLADRESMRRNGRPISGDRYVSMDHGPVLSQTLNLINGARKFEEQGGIIGSRIKQTTASHCVGA